MIHEEDMLEAWLECRKNKRHTAQAARFEANALDYVAQLTRTINDRSYRIGRSDCFVVTRPRYREVFAANFYDRVPHHYVAMRLEPLFEQHLNPNTFNCRKGKGQLYGINALKRHIFEASEGYTRKAYVMKVDLKGFFMSINKVLLAKEIDDFVQAYYQGGDKEDIRWLCGRFIMHEPTTDCNRKSPLRMWNNLPRHKSLFTCPKGKGLPIGNLFTQLFANWHLAYLDERIEGDFGQWHGRYVDDIYIISQDKQRLLDYVPEIRRMLAEKGMSLNEGKFYIQDVSKGAEFTGVFVRPQRTFSRKRTTDSLRGALKRLSKLCKAHVGFIGYHFIETLGSAVSSVNSYLGLMSKTSGFKRSKWLVMRFMGRECYRYCYTVIRRISGDRGSPIKVIVRRRFRLRQWVNEQIDIIIKHKEYGEYMAY